MADVPQFARQNGASTSAPKRQRRLTPEQIADMYRRFAAHEPLEAIAAAIGCGKKTVEYWRAQWRVGVPAEKPRCVKHALTTELTRARRAEREAQEQRSAERQLRAHLARQAALAAIREFIPTYDGRARRHPYAVGRPSPNGVWQ